MFHPANRDLPGLTAPPIYREADIPVKLASEVEEAAAEYDRVEMLYRAATTIPKPWENNDEDKPATSISGPLVPLIQVPKRLTLPYQLETAQAIVEAVNEELAVRGRLVPLATQVLSHLRDLDKSAKTTLAQETDEAERRIRENDFDGTVPPGPMAVASVRKAKNAANATAGQVESVTAWIKANTDAIERLKTWLATLKRQIPALEEQIAELDAPKPAKWVAGPSWCDKPSSTQVAMSK